MSETPWRYISRRELSVECGTYLFYTKNNRKDPPCGGQSWPWTDARVCCRASSQALLSQCVMELPGKMPGLRRYMSGHAWLEAASAQQMAPMRRSSPLCSFLQLPTSRVKLIFSKSPLGDTGPLYPTPLILSQHVLISTSEKPSIGSQLWSSLFNQ